MAVGFFCILLVLGCYQEVASYSVVNDDSDDNSIGVLPHDPPNRSDRLNSKSGMDIKKRRLLCNRLLIPGRSYTAVCMRYYASLECDKIRGYPPTKTNLEPKKRRKLCKSLQNQKWFYSTECVRLYVILRCENLRKPYRTPQEKSDKKPRLRQKNTNNVTIMNVNYEGLIAIDKDNTENIVECNI